MNVFVVILVTSMQPIRLDEVLVKYAFGETDWVG